MSTLCDITADLPPAANTRAVQGLTAEEAVALAEELAAYHQHFAPFFYRREQREWAAVYLRGLLTADVARKNVEAMALRLLGVGPHAERQVRARPPFVGGGGLGVGGGFARHLRPGNGATG